MTNETWESIETLTSPPDPETTERMVRRGYPRVAETNVEMWEFVCRQQKADREARIAELVEVFGVLNG